MLHQEKKCVIFLFREINFLKVINRFLFVLVSDQKRTVNTVSFMYNKDSSTIISVVGHAERLRMIGPLYRNRLVSSSVLNVRGVKNR